MNKEKVHCRQCRRTYQSTEPVCPFCGEDNPMLKVNTENVKPLQSQNLTPEDLINYFEEEEGEEYIPVQQNEEEEYEKPETDEIEYTDENADADYADAEEEMEEYIPEEQEDQSVSLSSTEHKHRIPIKWTDEKEKPEPDYTKMYDENGNYNANYDNYYNDTLPRIQNEVDKLLKGKEKSIIKIVASIVGVIAIIVYLVLTI